MSEEILRVQPIIIAHTQSLDRARILEEVSHVQIDSSPTEYAQWPFDERSPGTSMAIIESRLGVRVLQKLPIVADNNLHTALKTVLAEVDGQEQIAGTLPTVDGPLELSQMLHEVASARRNPHLLMATAIGGKRHARMASETTFHTVPLRGDLTLDEIQATFEANPDFHHKKGLKGIRFQQEQSSLIDWQKVADKSLLMTVLGGVDVTSWLRMMDTFFPHTLVEEDELWAVGRSEVMNIIGGEGMARVMTSLSRWRRDRKFFRAEDRQGDLELARTDVKRAFEEAVEMNTVFQDVSLRNGNSLAGPVVLSSNTQEELKKEVADVLIYLINAMEEVGYGYRPVLERLGSTDLPYAHTSDEIMRAFGRLTPESVMVRMAFLADKSFNNTNFWQEGQDAGLLDNISMLFDTAVRYMTVMGWNPVELLEQKIRENTFNYPEELCTDEIGPATSNAQVFALCRLFRKARVDGVQSLARYHQEFRGSTDLSVVETRRVGKDRSLAVKVWIRQELGRIVEQNQGSTFATDAEKLLEELDFSITVFEIKLLGFAVRASEDDVSLQLPNILTRKKKQ